MNQHIGSDFDDFLQEEDILEEVQAAALKKVIVCYLEQERKKMKLTKVEMAKRMKTSRPQLDRLLDVNGHYAVTLTSLTRAASALGKKISINLEDQKIEA